MNMRKIIAIMVAALMLLSILPITAFAADGDVYELVTDISELAVGDQVIIAATGYNVAMSTKQNTNNRGQVSAIKNSNTISYVTNMQVLTLEEGNVSGTFAFHTGSGYLYAASSSANYLRTESTLTSNSSWNISIDNSGNATIKSAGSYTRNWMRYNKSSSIFACYASGQENIAIYKLPIGAECDHTGLTCGDVCDVCGEEVAHKYSSNCDDTCNICGDTRMVTGHEYTGTLDNTCNNCGEIREVDVPTDPTEIVYAAYALASGEAFPKAVELTGVITSIDTEYSEQYKNITVTIDVIDAVGDIIYGMPIQCYRMTGDGVADITVDTVIKVSGILKNYSEIIEFDTGCQMLSSCNEHTYDGICDENCNNCGVYRAAAHDFDNACDDTCGACGATREVGDHDYTDELDTWCNECGAERTFEITSPEMDRDPSNPQEYVFSDFASGTQYALGEEHYLDNAVMVTTTDAHFTSELRLYSSASHDGYAIIRSKRDISAIVLNAGNNEDQLSVCYDSGDSSYDVGVGIDSSSYNNYTVLIPEMTRAIKLDVIGTKQIRIKSITLYFDGMTPDDIVCEEHVYSGAYDTTCNVCGRINWVDLPESGTELTIPEIYEITDGMDQDDYNTGDEYMYLVKGTVVEIENDQYGNMTIADEDGNELYVYGVYGADGSGFDYLEEKPAVGDTIVLLGCIGNYGGEPQMKKAYIQSFAPHVHSYDNVYDADCNDCNEIRGVSLPIKADGCSVQEDSYGIGLAVKFDISVKDLAIMAGKYTQADYTNATVDGYKLITMGAVAHNGQYGQSVEAKYLYHLDAAAEMASYAIRIINIPDDKKDVVITFTPYFVIEIDGEQFTIYGDPVARSYNGNS